MNHSNKTPAPSGQGIIAARRRQIKKIGTPPGIYCGTIPDMDCPLCHSEAPHFVTAHQRQYHHCPNCQMISVPPVFHTSREEEIERYREHENSLENPGYVDMFMEKIRLVRKHCPGIKTVLDYGCGYEPVLTTLLQREGYAAEGYDPLFFPDPPRRSAYDLIISTETFEHFRQPRDEITRILNLLAPQGALAVMTRLYPRAGGKLDPKAFADWYYQRDLTHICFYCTETFEWIAQRHNFDMILNNRKDFILLKRNTIP